MKKVIDIQLFPCVDYFKVLTRHKYVEFELFENFQKMSFRNRYIMAGANGLQELSIPVSGGREQRKRIDEVHINYSEKWQIKHWKSIISAYSKAPFFEFYSSIIKELLFQDEQTLVNYNVGIIKKLCKLLKLNVEIGFTTAYLKEYEDAVDLRNRILPKNFQNNSNSWEPNYPQVFENKIGFQPNLSILDLLFNEGPNTTYLLTKNSSTL